MFKNLRQAISAAFNRPMTPLLRWMFGALFILGAVLWRDYSQPPSSPVARVLPQTRLEDLSPAMSLCLGQAIGGGGGDCRLVAARAEAPECLIVERRDTGRRYAVCVGSIEKLRETLRREE